MEEGPWISTDAAAAILRTTTSGIDSLIAAGRLGAKTVGHQRVVRSGHVVHLARERKAAEIQRRSEPRGTEVLWFDDRGRELGPEPARPAGPVMFDCLPAGVHGFCAECPTGPNGRPCIECPMPDAEHRAPRPPDEHPQRRPLFDRIFDRK